MSTIDIVLLTSIASYFIGGFIEYIRPDGTYELLQELKKQRSLNAALRQERDKSSQIAGMR